MSNRGHWKIDVSGKLVDYKPEPVRHAHSIITDEIPPTKSMATGKVYTSKTKLRAEYRALGKIEIGNDPFPAQPEYKPWEDEKKMEELEEDITKAYYQCRDGMAPLSELDKEKCKIADKQLEESYDNRERDFLGKLLP